MLHSPPPIAELESLLDAPETYSTLVGDYRGPLSLGITVDETTREPCFLLRVRDEAVVRRRELVVGERTIRVIVRADFEAPTPG